MATRRARKRHKRGWLKWAAGAVLLVFLLLGVAISILLHRAEPMLRAAIVEKLEEHFHARVELDSFHVSLINGLWAEGKGLRIWPPIDVAGVAVPGPNGTDVTKPLITLDEFRFHAPLRYKPGEPIRIAVVELIGLDVDVPPKPHFTHVAEAAGSVAPGQAREPMLRFEIESMECKGAHLTLETSKPGKLPLEFAIAHIKLSHVSVGGSMQFMRS